MKPFTLNSRLNTPLPTPDESFNSMFGIDVTPRDGIKKLLIKDLRAFPDQPFKLYEFDALQELKANIAENGLLAPIIVRPMTDGTYQILAGHNRVSACQLLYWETIPAIIKDVNDDAAAFIMLDSNLQQRQELLPSEKAKAYKMQMELQKKQGKRLDLSEKLNFVPNGYKVDTASELGETRDEKRTNIYRYIRLTYLITPLLDMVDRKEIAVRAGVEISYRTEKEQQLLLDYLAAHKLSLDIKKAQLIKEHQGELIICELDRIFGKAVKHKKPPSTFKLPRKKLKTLIPDEMGNKDFEELVITLLEKHFRGE